MLVVGLTGGIGSGKSTVANLFMQHSIPVIDADVIARTLTAPDQAPLQKIIEHFGKDILLANGTLDRAKLRQIIFTDPTERQWLEALLHPAIRDEIECQLKKLSAPYCIVVIPLLFEVGPYPFINRILSIDIAEPQQIERVAKRDNITKTFVENILKTQTSRDLRKTKTHDVIANNHTIDALLPQVEKLHQKYLKLSAETS